MLKVNTQSTRQTWEPRGRSTISPQKYSGMLNKRTMKSLHIKYFTAIAVLIHVATGCVDQDFEDRKIQSVDSHGDSQYIISTAVTATGSTEFIAYSIPPSGD